MAQNTNINTMQAREESKEEAQNQRLSTGKIVAMVGSYALMFGFFAAFFTWNVIPGIILAAIMGIVGYYVIVPKEINARYFQYGLAQRHSFMSAITQIFGDGNNSGVTVQSALRESLVDLYGEFKQNIEGLLSIVGENGNGKRTHQAFVRIYDKYAGDIWFTEFMEQLETTEDEGIVNADSFHDLMYNANLLFDNQFKYGRQKAHQKHIFIVTNICILLAMFAVPCEGFGLHNFTVIYAHTGIGWVISAVYLIYMFILYHLMYKYFYDESITSVK